MRALSARQLLSIWERSLTESPARRALMLLSTACPDISYETLASLSLGQRDAHLLTLREWVFGSRLVSQEKCPNCSERLELDFNVADIRVNTEVETHETEEQLVKIGGYEIHFRFPNSTDLEVIVPNQGVTVNRNLLFNRCLIKAKYKGRKKSANKLPERILKAVTAEMSRLDPQADVQLNLTCPACSHKWQTTFDIISYFWSEIHIWAQQMLREVHILASAHGWHEADILEMSPMRRQFYLQMVGQ